MNKHGLEERLTTESSRTDNVTDNVYAGRRHRTATVVPDKPDIDPHDVLQILMDLTGVSHLIKRLVDRYEGADPSKRMPVYYLVKHGSRKVFRVSGERQDTCRVRRFLGRHGYVESIDDAVSLAELRQMG